MSILEITTIVIALLSLAVSVYVVVRDNKNNRFEILMTMYDRLESANAKLQSKNQYEDAKKLKWKIDRELETACFLLFNNKIDKKLFYNLYCHWLSARNTFWFSNAYDMAEPCNNPYTVWAIKTGLEKHFLENSKKKQKFLKKMTDYIVSRKKKI